MKMREWLRQIETEQPGLTERVWTLHGRGYTADDDQACAQAVTQFAQIRGERIEINAHAWKEHRAAMRMVSRHVKKATEVPGEPAMLEAPAQDLVPPSFIQMLDVFVQRDTQLAITLSHLGSVIERFTRAIEHTYGPDGAATQLRQTVETFEQWMRQQGDHQPIRSIFDAIEPRKDA